MKSGDTVATSGFTILEMLVVIGLLSVIFAVVIAARPKAAQLRLQTEVSAVVAELQRARGQAMATNQEAVIRVDVSTGRIFFDKTTRDLPRGMSVAMTIASAERFGQSGGLRFYPDGQSSGGEISLALDGRSSVIVVNWLTGQPRVVR